MVALAVVAVVVAAVVVSLENKEDYFKNLSDCLSIFYCIGKQGTSLC